MVTGLLAVLIAGHIVGSAEGRTARGYPTYDRGYYGDNGGRGYADCGGYGCRGYEYGYRSYSSRGYDYGYRGYGYGD
jgi:hypothetical protein